MQVLRILMLVVVLALAYLLALRPQTKTDDLPPDLVQAQPATPGSPGPHNAPAGHNAHSQYKEAMDRAHAAAKQMQDARADSDSF